MKTMSYTESRARYAEVLDGVATDRAEMIITRSGHEPDVLLVWDENAWEDYLWWQAQDRRTLKRIDTLLADIQRKGDEGIGKPEPLKHDFAGYWFRRITDEHRLVYKIVGNEVRIAACRYHYG